MNNSDGPWIRPTEKDMVKFKTFGSDPDAVEKILRQSLLDWVASGGGIVAFHYAIGANTHWPQFQELLGAGYSGHPWNEEVGVKVEEPTHPLVAAFGGKDFRIADEIFQFRQPYDRAKLRVLLSLDTKTTNMTVPWIERKDGDFALAWVRPRQGPRLLLGHRPPNRDLVQPADPAILSRRRPVRRRRPPCGYFPRAENNFPSRKHP